MSESLQNEFENMMAYSLGEDWRDLNIRHAPERFNSRNSSCGPLVSFGEKTKNYNAAFFVFQMTLLWLEHESVDYVLRDPKYNTTLAKESNNESNIQNIYVDNGSVFNYIWDFCTSLRSKIKSAIGRQ